MGLDHYLYTKQKGTKKTKENEREVYKAERDFRKNYHLQDLMVFYLGEENLLKCDEELITEEMYKVMLGRLEMYEKKLITLEEFIPECHYNLNTGEWGEDDYEEMVEVLKIWIPENVNWETDDLYYNCWY